MRNQYILDPAEKWLSKQILNANEYYTFLKEPKIMRNEIKKRIFDEIRTFISESHQKTPPFDTEKIMQYRKIKKIIWNKKLTYRESLLIPIRDGFIIQINPNKSQTRIRFSCAHEFGHTYFFDLEVSPPHKFYPVSSSRSWVEEGYACEIAREILMPEPYISKITSKLSKIPSLSSFIQLKNEFNISYEILIKRLLIDAHLWNNDFWGNNLWNCIIITAELSSNDESNIPRIKVYRAPKYKYILRDVRHNKDIIKIMKNILRNNAKIDKSIEIGKRKTKYHVQGNCYREWAKMAILIIKKDEGDL